MANYTSRKQLGEAQKALIEQCVALGRREKSLVALLQPHYSTKILKGTALLQDTMALLASWDRRLSVEENLQRARHENMLGKSSRARAADVLDILRQRYFANPDVVGALVALVQGGQPVEVIRPVLYYFAAQSDRLLHDTVTLILHPLAEAGRVEIYPQDILTRISAWVEGGKTAGPWSEITRLRVVQNLLATLRDFGILHGATRKRIAPVYIPPRAFALIAFQLYRRHRSGNGTLHSPEWCLFLLAPPVVERLFVEAQQEHWLQYHAAGSTVRLDFPAATLEGYADALTQRTD